MNEPETSVESEVAGPIMRHSASISGDGEDAEIRGVIEIADGCVYLYLSEVNERYPVIWPHNTSWDAQRQAIILPSGDVLGAGDAVSGGGGYRYVEAIERVAGPQVAVLAAGCVDNTYGEIAVVNNSPTAIGPVTSNN